jgi:hypothetical protein
MQPNLCSVEQNHAGESWYRDGAERIAITTMPMQVLATILQQSFLLLIFLWFYLTMQPIAQTA